MLRITTATVLAIWIMGGPTLAEDPPLLHLSDFSGHISDDSRKANTVSVRDGALHVEGQPNSTFYQLEKVLETTDVDARIQISQLSGNAEAAAGLLFWAKDGNDCYCATVDSSGYVEVKRYQNRVALAIIPVHKRAELHTGLNAVNELRVVTSGQFATVYMNGQVLFDFRGFPSPDNCRWGVICFSSNEPAHWKFSDFRMHAGPKPDQPAPRNESLIMHEDFKALDPGWGKSSDEKNVIAGQLAITPKAGRIVHQPYFGHLFSDVDMSCDIESETPQTETGLIFWSRDLDRYYAVFLTPQGDLSVLRRMGDHYLPVVPKRRCPGKFSDSSKKNAIRVVTSGRHAMILVNGKEVVKFRGFPPQGGSHVGVIAKSDKQPERHRFSNLVIRHGPAPEPDSSPVDHRLLFAEDFSTVDPAWWAGGDEIRVRDRHLWLRARKGQVESCTYLGSRVADMDFCVRFKINGKWKGEEPGVVFWKGTASYHAATVSSQGALKIMYALKDKVRIVKTLQLPASILSTAAGSTNELRVVTRRTKLSMFVNSRHVGDFEAKSSDPAGIVGLCVMAGNQSATVGFSDLIVRRPQVVPGAPNPDCPGLVLEDDFQSLLPGWSKLKDGVKLQNGRLLLNGKKEGHNFIHYNSKMNDVDLHVSAVQEEGPSDASAGVSFWTSSESSYVALLQSDGTFQVLRIAHGMELRPVPPHKHPAVKTGLGAVNRLRIVTAGSKATIYVNDELVTTFRGFPPANPPRFGFYVPVHSVPPRWSFSNLMVYQVPDEVSSEPRQEAVLAFDGFERLDPAWGLPDEQRVLKDGRLHLSAEKADNRTNFYEGDVFADYELRIRAAPSSPNSLGSGGLVVLGRDTKNFHSLTVDNKGKCVVAQWKDGVPTALAQMTLKKARDTTDGHLLFIRHWGPHVDFYVDDELIGAIEEIDPTLGRKTGLIVVARKEFSTWAFDDFEVRKANTRDGE